VKASAKRRTPNGGSDAGKAGGKLKGKLYAEEMRRLHVELVKLQEWVKHAGYNAAARAGPPPFATRSPV
jgi:hypothetical protein